jgi:sugar-phosphatase
MSARRQIHAAIFDMDGLLIDSEPLWDKAELEVMASLGVDISRRHEMPDILGLRIDLVVDLWFAQQPWKGPDRAEVTARIINRAIQLVEEARPLLPGARKRWRCAKPRVENRPGVGFAAADAGKSPHHV